MKIIDIIRQVLDLIDQAEPEKEQPTMTVDIVAPVDQEDELARIKQIAGLRSVMPTEYANEPQEAVADIDAVTGTGTDLMKSKHPADIRTNAPSMYPAAQWRGE